MGTEKRERQKANRALKNQQIQQQASRRKTMRLIAIGVGAVVGVFLIAWIASNFVSNDSPSTPTDTVVTESIVPGTIPLGTLPTPGTVATSTGG